MDEELEQALTGTVRETLLRLDPDKAPEQLLEDGWDEISAEEPGRAWAVLFETAGQLVSSAPLLDLVRPGPDVDFGPRPVLPLDGLPAPESGELLVRGVALGSQEPLRYVVVTAGAECFVVEAAVLSSTSVAGIDPTSAPRLVTGSVALDAARRVVAPGFRDLVRRCGAHYLVGLADRAAALVQQHAEKRHQFGRSIATWQTVQHRLADAHVEIVAARALLDSAWLDARPLITDAAIAQAARAAATTIDHAQQIFGAIGFTAEHPLPAIVRRWQLHAALLGPDLDSAVGRAVLADPDLEATRVRL